MEDEIKEGGYVKHRDTGKFGIVKKIMPDKRYMKIRVVPTIWDIWCVDDVVPIKDAKE